MTVVSMARAAALGAVLLATAAASTLAGAQAPAYPTKPITIIVPFPAGGGTSDLLARVIGQKLTEAWGQPVIVENRPGASGNIGAGAGGQGAARRLHDPARRRRHLHRAGALQGSGLQALRDADAGHGDRHGAVHAGRASIAAGDQRRASSSTTPRRIPNKLSLGSGGNGTIPHLGGELFKMRAGIEFTHVPYKGGIQAMNDLVGGQIQFTIDGGSHVVTQIDAGKIAPARGDQRRSACRSTRTCRRWPSPAIPGFEASAWQMLLVHRRHAEAHRRQDPAGSGARAEARPTWPSACRSSASCRRASRRREAETFLRAEMAKWGEVIKVSGAKVD